MLLLLALHVSLLLLPLNSITITLICSYYSCTPAATNAIFATLVAANSIIAADAAVSYNKKHRRYFFYSYYARTPAAANAIIAADPALIPIPHRRYFCSNCDGTAAVANAIIATSAAANAIIAADATVSYTNTTSSLFLLQLQCC